MEQLLQAFEDDLIEIKYKSPTTAKHAGYSRKAFLSSESCKRFVSSDDTNGC